MVGYSIAVFGSAFLLFQVQPLLGKYILPSFGGAPAVWTSCLLIFQVLLLAGYAYAHLITRYLQPRKQAIVHLTLLTAAICLPITPDMAWKPSASQDPTLRVCGMLLCCIGLQFFVLSATAPLLQHWFSLVWPSKSPFRLYAFSNVGSQLALLSYPIVFETFFGRRTQIGLWRAGLGIFAVSFAWTAIRVWDLGGTRHSNVRTRTMATASLGDKALWVLLPACGSLLLAAVTNKICQDVAPIALLWVLPLSVYLLSFILCFNSPRTYRRHWFAPLLLAGVGTMGLLLAGAFEFSAQTQVLVFLGGLFICCMVCHGELFRLKPDPTQLTSYYLMMSAGGALGGGFVALIAARIFSDYFELDWGLLGVGALFWVAVSRDPNAHLSRSRAGLVWIGTAALAGLGLILWIGSHEHAAARVYRSRNFYGVLNVYRHDSGERGTGLMELVHGRVAHGAQFLETNRAQIPTLYYAPDSGIGRAFGVLAALEKRDIGVVGLGAGTIAAYLRPSDQITFYEINPEVERIANTYFSFLRSCPGRVKVILGDARLSLENQTGQNFDLLVLDAFNGDAIPVHLLTREAFVTYQRHTKPGGILAVHVSNLSLNLEPVVFKLANEFGWTAQVLEQGVRNEGQGLLPSTWILLFRGTNFADLFTSSAAARPMVRSSFSRPLWTDDFNGLFSVLRWWDVAPKPTLPADRPPDSVLGSVQRANRMLAIERFRNAVATEPNSSVALNNLACLLATSADPALRNGPEAVRLAEKACALTGYNNTSTLSTLAAAYAEVGRFDEAVATAEKAGALAAEKGEAAMVAGNRQMLTFFREKRPFRQANP